MDLPSIVILILWLASEIFLNRMLRSAADDKQNADKNSIRIIWLVIAVATTAGSLIGNFYYISFGSYYSYHKFIHPLALALILTGMTIRYIAVRSLGKMFTVDVTIRKNHQLLTTGIYKRVRNPSYTGSIISFIGLGFLLNNVLSMVIIVVPVFLSFVYRVSIEEKLLAEAFGEEYEKYKKRSKRFFPGIY